MRNAGDETMKSGWKFNCLNGMSVLRAFVPRFPLLVIVGFLFFLPAVVRADTPLAEYRTRVGQASKTVEKVVKETIPCTSVRAREWSATSHLPEEIRKALEARFPAKEMVTIDARQTVQVENRPILDLLSRQADAVDCATSIATLKRLDDLLRSLDEQLARGEIPDPAGAGKRANVSEILSRPEFQPVKKEKTPFEKLQEWLTEKLLKWLSRVAPGADVQSPKYAAVLRVILYVVLAAGVVLLGVVLYRRFLKRAPKEEKESGKRVILGEVLDEKTTVDELMAEAAKYAQAGDYRQAVRKVYIALLYDMDKRDVIRIEPSLTNREYLRAVRAQVRLYPPMRDLTDRFDLIWYGQGTVGAGEYEEFVARYREAFGALPAAA